MKKILVTTDFSDHSKSGLRFAVQLAAQNDYHLTFFNVHHLHAPSAWDSVRMDEYQDEQKKLIETKLVHFVEKIYATMQIEPKHLQYAVELSVLPESCILEYAEKHHYDYICISSRGTGVLKKVLGTITSNLINGSKVPVIVVPYDHKLAEIKSILYASDLEQYENEINKVISFAKPLQASIELVNFVSEPSDDENRRLLETHLKKMGDYPVSIHIGKKKGEDSLTEAIEAAVKNSKPSLLVMFTKQDKNWFQNIFYVGNSAEYSFRTQVPLLVFRKQ